MCYLSKSTNYNGKPYNNYNRMNPCWNEGLKTRFRSRLINCGNTARQNIEAFELGGLVRNPSRKSLLLWRITYFLFSCFVALVEECFKKKACQREVTPKYKRYSESRNFTAKSAWDVLRIKADSPSIENIPWIKKQRQSQIDYVSLRDGHYAVQFSV